MTSEGPFGDSVAGIWGDPAPAGAPAGFDGERYARGGLLGVGGMGRVFAARDRVLERDVALKECRPDAPAGARARLSREARITAGLEHPGVLPVYDAGQDPAGTQWYVMRLVRGDTLAARIAAAGADRSGLLRPMLAAAEAVAYAHSRGVLHRDLKPDNILVGSFGETQVADWGLAVRVDEVPAERVGSPGYMAPEQERGEVATTRSDVWSLGTILGALADAEQAELQSIVARATSRDPSARYPDAGAFAADLAAYIDGRRVDAYAYSPRELLVRLLRLWRAPLTVAGIALVVLATAVAVGWVRTDAARAAAARSAAVALLGQARNALDAGDDAEAERLARASQDWEDSAGARGLLAAQALRTPVTVTDLGPGRGECAQEVLTAEGFACIRHDVLELRTGEHLRRRPGLLDRNAEVLRAGDAVFVAADDLSRRDPRDGAVLERLATPGDRVRAVASGPRGGLAAWGGKAAYARARPDAPFEPIDWCRPEGFVAAAAFAGERLLVVCTDLRYGWHDLDSPDATADRRFSQSWALRGLLRVVHVKGSRFAFLGAGGAVTLVDVAEGTLLHREVLADEGLPDAAVSPDGELLVVRSFPGTLYAYRPSTGTHGRLPVREISDVRFHADGSLRVLGDRLLRVEVPTADPVWRLDLEHGISSVRSHDDGRVAVATGGGSVVVWDPDAEARAETPLFTGVAKGAAWDGDDVVAVASLSDPWAAYRVTPGGPESLGIAGALRRVAVVDGYGPVALTYAERGGVVRLPLSAPPQIWGEALYYDMVAAGDRLVVRGVDGAVAAARFDGTALVGEWSAAVDGVGPVALHASGHVAVAAEAGVLLLDPRGAVVRTLPDSLRITALAWSPSGDRVAVGAVDGTTRVWRASGALEVEHAAHDGRVSGLDFRGPRELVTGGWDGVVRRWKLPAPVRARGSRSP